MRKSIGKLAAGIGAVVLLGASGMVVSRPASPAPAAVAPKPKGPNILFILIDDMGYGDLSVTGNTLVATPNIDRLAREGIIMTQYYDAAPICSASRAGAFTGQFPVRNRFVNFIDNRAHNAQTGQADWLDPKVPTIARTLHDSGYATGQFGKWHMGGGRDVGDAPLPTDYGFDESYTQFEGLGPRVIPQEIKGEYVQATLKLGHGQVDQLPRGEITSRFIDKALDFMERHKAQPWYIQLWPDDMHEPWIPTPEQEAAVKGKGRSPAEEKFFGVLVAMDAQIGRMIETLRRTGQLDNTLIVFTSDNGPTGHAGPHNGYGPGSAGIYRGRKGSLYEGGSRQALIVRWPGHVAPGQHDATTIGNGVDLLPTFAAIAGAKPPAKTDGINLLPAWQGHPITKRPDLFWTFGAYGPYKATPRPALARDRSPSFSIRSGDWKLLAEGDGSHAELYNIAQDPSETTNIAASHQDLVKSLTMRLIAWRKSLPLTPSYDKPVVVAEPKPFLDG